MNRILTAALCGIAVTTVAGSVLAQNKPSTQDKKFLATVSEGNIAEIKTAKLALNRTKSSDVRMIANMIIKGHSQAQNSAAYLAKTRYIRVPMAPNAEHRRAYNMLSRMSGANFDRAYLKGQVKDHYRTIQAFNREMTIGKDSAIVGFANQYIPDVQAHTVMIDKAAKARGLATPAKFTDKMPANHKM